MIPDEKPKRKKKPHRRTGLWMWLWIVACFVGTLMCIATVFLGSFALIFANSYSTCFGTPFPLYEDVENGVLFKFPPSAQHIEFDADSSDIMEWNCTAWITFEIAPSDIKVFQESTLVESLEQTLIGDEGRVFTYFMEKRGWSQPSDSLVGQGSTNGTYPPIDHWILIDTSFSESYIVYMIADVNGI